MPNKNLVCYISIIMAILIIFYMKKFHREYEDEFYANPYNIF